MNRIPKGAKRVIATNAASYTKATKQAIKLEGPPQQAALLALS